MSRLVFHGVSKFYGDVLGVIDVSLDVEAGVTGLLGPNGAGKSTLIQLAVGLLCPDQGRSEINGVSVWGNPRLGAGVGYVPHADALPPHQTGLEFVRSLLRFHGLPARTTRETAEAALDRVGLADVARRRLSGYSKGMRQRLKLAQALAHDPPLLILDEPLTGLDPVGRRDIIRLVRELGDDGRTVLVSSHILHEVEAMTDRVALMRSGRLIAAGRIDELRSGLLAHPYRIRAMVDDPRPLAARMISDAAVRSVRCGTDGSLVIETPDPDAVLTRLNALAADGGTALASLDVEDQDLEAVFRYTVDR